ncbi:disulfide bond formation protein B [Falsiroseomonas oryzae]|uniref:disulfide bond formation protein B n=1 Tax=Falsiroseomonas oryzae TaxID=2766473 RepID=UPI0022EB3627|nr:disulfide bond formation protein B [Roseomonas sp. MO-31]
MPFPLGAALLAAAAPLLAMGSERWPGLAPCALCLWQRWPYWVAAGIALLALTLPARWRPWALRAAALAVLASAAVAVLHVGVEFRWWPSPLPACLATGAGGATSVEELMRNLAPQPNKPCDEPAYLIPFLPLSMAQMNLIYALALAAFIWRGAGRSRRRT